jgi:hypothetical protein
MPLLTLLWLLLAGLALLARPAAALEGVEGYCSVRIRPTRNTYQYTSNLLYLREVELYGKAGRIDLRQNIAVSSVYPGTSPSYCVDQYVSSTNEGLCVTNSGDPYPTVTVRYLCPLGKTIGALGRVSLYNVVVMSDVTLARSYMLSNFTVDFLDAYGIPDTLAWVLGPYNQQVYSYYPPSEWQPGVPADPIPPPPPPGRPAPASPEAGSARPPRNDKRRRHTEQQPA